VVRADPGRLRQVVYNLLSNAFKFTPPGGNVHLEAAVHGDRALVRVRDEGRGVSASDLPHIFEPFSRANSNDSQGLGLGLAVAKHIINEHGGALRAESGGPGCGTTITFELPLAQATAGHPQPAALVGLHVLLVHDNPDERETLGEVLAAEGALVVRVASATEGLEALGRRAPDVIVCAIALPGEDGLWFVRKLRALATPAAHIAALALTEVSRPEQRQQAERAGYQRNLERPPNPHTLIEVLAELCGASVFAGEPTSLRHA
ncbi:MAG TPA: hybrid sensor histidine kinase/response regulator, partial [Polyangiaceae bacterium]|nr:hybrid sensor histidine kinase/response regulator [Polyangiaceae bacterium]